MYVCACVCVCVCVCVGVCVCVCVCVACLSAFIIALVSHEMGRHKLPIIIIIKENTVRKRILTGQLVKSRSETNTIQTVYFKYLKMQSSANTGSSMLRVLVLSRRTKKILRKATNPRSFSGRVDKRMKLARKSWNELSWFYRRPC